MPEISRFRGIAIRMFHREHGVPHFHAVYAEYGISVDVESGILRGIFPGWALRHVLEWADLRKGELLANWELGRQGKPLGRIAPLE